MQLIELSLGFIEWRMTADVDSNLSQLSGGDFTISHQELGLPNSTLTHITMSNAFLYFISATRTQEVDSTNYQ